MSKQKMNPDTPPPGGVFLLDKPVGKSSFHLVHLVRKKFGVQKVGHAGTLDPFASGLLIILVGRLWTSRQKDFMMADKEYVATIALGVSTDTYDLDGVVTRQCDHVPSLEEVHAVLQQFQGHRLQTPPMYSAKKKAGTRLYKLARQGIEVAREPVPIWLELDFLFYEYPILSIHVRCSKGTYVRTLAHEIGEKLGTCGHLTALRRTRSGAFCVSSAISYEEVVGQSVDELKKKLITEEQKILCEKA